MQILQETEASTEAMRSICRKHAISEMPFCRWHKYYDGMQVIKAVRLLELERLIAAAVSLGL